MLFLSANWSFELKYVHTNKYNQQTYKITTIKKTKTSLYHSIASQYIDLCDEEIKIT